MGAYPQVVDYNSDGRLDMIASDSSGAILLFRNVGKPGEPSLAKGERIEADGQPIPMKRYAKVHMGDYDEDGLPDLLIGYDREVHVYGNRGEAGKPLFKRAADLPIKFPERPFLFRPSAYVVDWDGDGRSDLLLGTETSRVMFYRNVGEPGTPRYAQGVDLDLQGKNFENGYRCRIDVTDWNGDGRLDLLVGNCAPGSSDRRTGGHVWLFLRKKTTEGEKEE